MSVDNVLDVTPRVQYVAITGQTDFDYPFPIFDDGDLVVDVDGVTQTLSTDYTVTGEGEDTGGTVTFLSAMSGGEIVTIYRDIPIERTSDFQQNGPLRSATFNDELDKLTMILQQLESRIGRAVRMALTNPQASSELEIGSNFAERFLYINSDLELEPAVGITNVGALTGGILRDLLGDESYLFRIHDAETQAGLVTGDLTLGFNVGDIRRYGATGDGTTDDTLAVQRAFNTARYGFGRVHFPAARNGRTIYRFASITVYGYTDVTSERGVLCRKNGTGASTTHIFDCISTFGTATALTANTAKRDDTVLVTSAAGLSVGQHVRIHDSQFKWSTNGRNMEHNEIAAISGLTITLKKRLIGAYLTANTAQLVPVTESARSIRFWNVQCDIPTTEDGGAFYFEDAYECELVNCGSSGQKGQAGVQTWRSTGILVTGGRYSDGQSQSTPGYGYGIAFAQSSNFCVAYGVTTNNVRENAISLGSRFCKFEKCDAHSTYDNSFNTHADGNEDCDIVNCRSFFARSKGFVAGGVTGQAADKRIRFIGCENHYSGYIGFWADGASGVESEDIQFIYCKDFHPGDDTATSFSFYAFRSIRPLILNCRSNADGESNVRACIKVEICSDAVVRGNNVRGATSGWGIIHANCTGVQIDDNVISNIGSSQGVHAESTASTKAYIRRNKVDNDTNFTRVSGDILVDNEWNTKRQQARGSTSAADGGTITHGLIATPTGVLATTTTSGEFVSISAKGGTTFTVAIKKHDGTAGTTANVDWQASYD